MSQNSPFSGINHLAMVTGNMDKTVRFYRDVLGCRLVATIGANSFRHYFFEIGKGNSIAFFEWPGIEPVAAVKEKPVPGPQAQPRRLSGQVMKEAAAAGLAPPDGPEPLRSSGWAFPAARGALERAMVRRRAALLGTR